MTHHKLMGIIIPTTILLVVGIAFVRHSTAENKMDDYVRRRTTHYVSGVLQPVDQKEIEYAIADYHKLECCKAFLEKDYKEAKIKMKEIINYLQDIGLTEDRGDWVLMQRQFNEGDTTAVEVKMKLFAQEILNQNVASQAQQKAEMPVNTNTIEYSVAMKAVREYGIAERQGDRMQMYTQAAMCAAAFLQAEDEADYKKWKAIERQIGSQIGIPQY